jgi:N-acetylglucosamine-6-sulfatase
LKAGERELYDNGSDPHQLRNVAGSASPTLLSSLSALTAALATCKADVCRQLEDAPVASLRAPAVPRR